MHKLKVAIIGTGSISQAHARALLAFPNLYDIQWVCDVNEQASAAFVKQLNLQSVCFTDFQLLLTACKPDAAIITLPHYLHMPVAGDFIQSKIPVLIEKPAVCNLSEARILRDLTAQNQSVVLIGQTRRFLRETAWLHRWVQSTPSPFGELESFELTAWQNVFSYLGGKQNLSHWILDGSKAGGGVVISVAIHQIDLLRYLSGVNFKEVEAYGRFDAPFHHGAESAASVSFLMANGAVGTLNGNYLAQRVPYCEALRAFGSQGSINQVVDTYGQYIGEYYYSSSLGKETNTWQDQFNDFVRVPVDEVKDWVADGFTNQARHFYDVIVNGTLPICGLVDNWNSLACVEAVYESIRSGKPVEVVKD